VHSLDEAKTAVADADEIMVMGGAEIYVLLFDQAERLYITEIDAEFEGDAWFTDFNRSLWKEIFRESHRPDERNPYPYAFMILERKSA